MPDEEEIRRSQNDWRTLVRERLGALSLNAATQEDVIAELASHLEDRVAAAIRGGVSEQKALTAALDEVPDWVALNHEIIAAKKEESMTQRTRSLWLPGMTMLLSAFVVMSTFARAVGDEDDIARVRDLIATSSGALVFFAAWLAVYGGLGAVGALWSRRAGGDTRTRLVAGLFPIALHVVIVVAAFTATSLQASPRTPEWLVPGFLLRVFLTFILAPAIALAFGALPFLRDGSSRGPMVADGNR